MLVGGGPTGPNERTPVHESPEPVGEGQLVLVATPLGNLGDLSRRALELLTSADVIYCEDTRHSRTLFSAHAIATRGRLQSLHQHNEAAQCATVVQRVRDGQEVVLISDAGTPGISDPGSRVVEAVVGAGLRVTTAPGPSAVIAALTISGLSTERFVMEGFVPRKAGERALWYEQWRHEPRTIVVYESPQRLANTMQELVEHFGDRRVVVAREMTKLHEEIIRGTVRDVAAQLARRSVLGEVVVVLEGASPDAVVDETTLRAALAAQLAGGATVRDAVTHVASALGVAHRAAYRLALELRESSGP